MRQKFFGVHENRCSRHVEESLHRDRPASNVVVAAFIGDPDLDEVVIICSERKLT